MKLTDEVINDIRNSASITEVIGHYIPLIKKGRGYTAVCPFHDDHDPSLSISEDKQIYKCFVCNNGGNVFSFVMNYKKIGFVEAVAEVSKVIGKPLDIDVENKPKAPSKYQRYYDVMDETVKFSNYILSTYAGDLAMNYLNQRGLSKEIIDYFGIGYNPVGDALYKYLKSKNIKDDDMIKTNVCRMTDFGIKDVFANRIIFPIHDINGNPIAFSGRIIDNSSEAKYVNTSSTLIYTKGDVVYNYHRAKEEIKRSKRVIVCEGVMDVIAFKRAEISNVVATLGTACTVKQLELISAISNHIVFCYDGDNAGKNATMKAIELALNLGIETYVLKNDTELDPDEIITKGKAKDLRDFANHEISGIEFAFDYYQKLYPLNNYSNRKAFHLKLSNLISMLKDPYDRENYFHDLKNLTGFTKNETQSNKIEYNKKNPIILNNEHTIDGLLKAEYIVITQMILSKKAVEIYRRDLGCLFEEINDEIASIILDEYRKNGECSFASIYDSTNNNKIKDILLEIGMIDTLPNRYEEDILNGAINRIKLEIKKIKLEDLKQKISKYENVSEEEYIKYLSEYTKLTRDLGGSYGKE